MRKSRSEYRDGYKAHIAIEPETGFGDQGHLDQGERRRWALRHGARRRRRPGADGARPTPGMRQVRRWRHSRQPSTAPPSSLGRSDPQFRAASIGTTLLSITTPAPPPVPPGTRSRSPLGSVPPFQRHCGGCVLRARCTAARRGRTLELTAHDKELVERRASWRRGEFKEDYRRFRPMVERAIAWFVADTHRRVRFPRSREEPTRALASHRRHQPQTPDQPRPGSRRSLDAQAHLIQGAQAQVSNRGTSPMGSAQPGWPASTLFVLALRFGHTRACSTEVTSRSAFFNSLLEPEGGDDLAVEAGGSLAPQVRRIAIREDVSTARGDPIALAVRSGEDGSRGLNPFTYPSGSPMLVASPKESTTPLA